MLLIYTHQVTNRVKYTLGVIFNSILGIEYNVTSDAESFKKYEGAKISYTHTSIENELFFQSSGLLFETGIKASAADLFPRTERIEDAKDIFSLTFFLASRYEEYLPFTADHYGRFSAKQSLAFKNNFLHRPVINIWADGIRKKLFSRYPALIFPEKKYSYIPTIDIDNAYAYLGKNLWRTLGGYVRAIIRTDLNDFTKRMKVLSNQEKDPYDTYEFMSRLHSMYNLKPIIFFLLGDRAENDKNLPHTSPLMQTLVKNIIPKAEIGIHPSYASNQQPEKVKIEKQRLKDISGKDIHRSRQHFLKLRFPETYRNLIQAGIADDYTMGYADEIGFRAGICSAYKWYDLEKEEPTDLVIHPFAIMDGTLNNYLKLSTEQSLQKAKGVIQEVKNMKGQLITIWHNETLSDWRDWRGWKQVYEKVIQAAV